LNFVFQRRVLLLRTKSWHLAARNVKPFTISWRVRNWNLQKRTCERRICLYVSRHNSRTLPLKLKVEDKIQGWHVHDEATSDVVCISCWLTANRPRLRGWQSIHARSLWAQLWPQYKQVKLFLLCPLPGTFVTFGTCHVLSNCATTAWRPACICVRISPNICRDGELLREWNA
jgi:hypothetical protein